MKGVTSSLSHGLIVVFISPYVTWYIFWQQVYCPRFLLRILLADLQAAFFAQLF
jgi:hypothetical protein